VVKAWAPDVALIQEAPTWWGTRRRREAMAASCGLRYVAAVARNASSDLAAASDHLPVLVELEPAP
jgi:endonuclease/exonuclease/phosphatase (EEP) superfamily protein YafD